MQAITVPVKVRRGPVLYARLKKENHAWIHAQSQGAGYDSTSEYVDALIETLRAGGKTSTPKTATKAPKAKRARSSKK